MTDACKRGERFSEVKVGPPVAGIDHVRLSIDEDRNTRVLWALREGKRSIAHLSTCFGDTCTESTFATRLSVGPRGMSYLMTSPSNGRPILALKGPEAVPRIIECGNLDCSDPTSEPNAVVVYDRAEKSYETVSLTGAGLPPNAPARAPRISGNGQFVVFESDASDLGPSICAANRNVFRHDRSSHETLRMSVGPSGAEPSARSYGADVNSSGDVVFSSDALDLVVPLMSAPQVYLHQR